MRSHLKWLDEGEKPTNFFCNLEKQHFTEKTIKKLRLKNGSITSDQKTILEEIRHFYAQLFDDKSTNDTVRVSDLDDILHSVKKNKVKNVSIGQKLETSEVTQALKVMKNNKTPGIDGISVDFLKVFWTQLKFFVTRALNCCFEKGKLSCSLRQSVIICLPKGEKDRQLLKN